MVTGQHGRRVTLRVRLFTGRVQHRSAPPQSEGGANARRHLGGRIPSLTAERSDPKPRASAGGSLALSAPRSCCHRYPPGHGGTDQQQPELGVPRAAFTAAGERVLGAAPLPGAGGSFSCHWEAAAGGRGARFPRPTCLTNHDLNSPHQTFPRGFCSRQSAGLRKESHTTAWYRA